MTSINTSTLANPAERSRSIVQSALQLLINLSHRSATGGDAETGDGAGILIQLPHAFLIGGEDTGSDCAGTAVRQGAKSVRQFELMPMPPETRSDATPWPLWPLWPMQLRSSHAHEESTDRDWSVATTEFTGVNGTLTKVHCTRVEGTMEDGGWVNRPVRGSELSLDADLVLLAMGFAGVEDSRLLRDLGVKQERGNVSTGTAHRTSAPGVFAAGDARRGASLIVWAIRAAAIDRYLAAGYSL
ncbi:MAG: FAD-dependent oxidoreductase [Gemmatimonadaceae bacterium]